MKLPYPGLHPVVLAVLLVLASACATAPTPNQPAESGSAPPEQARVPKRITIGLLREPNTVNAVLVGDSPVGGVEPFRRIVQNYLVIQDDKLAFVPQLAAEQLSVDKGTWRVNADGSMDTIWNLRPNAKWHDGAPFTADDLVFAFNVYKDPAVPNKEGAILSLMESASAPDRLTFSVHWPRSFFRANEAIGLEPLPRHLLEELYTTDKANLGNSAYFTTGFVGLGTHRLVKWEQGSHVEFAAFDAYYRGRPAIDSVVVQFLRDPNTMVANILAGSVDVILPTGVNLEGALGVKERWEGTQNQYYPVGTDMLRFMEPQYRPEYARPTNGLSSPLVRRALYSSLDRKTIAEVLTHGYSPVADSWIPQSHELRAQVENVIPQYPYDLRRAQDLLTEAGWVRAADGTLTHQPDGERFVLDVRVNDVELEREATAAADGWKALGVQATIQVLPTAVAPDAEAIATYSGIAPATNPLYRFYSDRLLTQSVAAPGNRWSGRNRGGFSDPSIDALLGTLAGSIAPPQQLPLHRELLQRLLGDVVVMPMYWAIDSVLAVKGVKGVRGRDTWNLFEWDRE